MDCAHRTMEQTSEKTPRSPLHPLEKKMETLEVEIDHQVQEKKKGRQVSKGVFQVNCYTL